ncbi:MAG: transketolase [Ignavibacteriae bacterium]|nr:transketolase [Ignavibacteriota bacterium]
MTFTEKCINTIRFLSIDGVQKANSGHPGMPMGCAPITYLLYSKIMKHNPKNPSWFNRDRFVLSAGHGSMLLYSSLHLSGYEITLDDLKNFRQLNSITPGHPERGMTPGVETTTGPLGQGFANSVGMALASKHLAAKFNKDDLKLIDNYIYVIASDGDMMEGVSHETASIAGHLKLDNLIVFYDNNNITIDGSLDLAMSENVGQRFEAYGWHVQHVKDVNNIEELEKAVIEAKKVTDKPSIIITDTHIGFGSPNKQDTASAHGSPLGEEEIKLTKKNLGWEYDETFVIPDDVKDYFLQSIEKGKLEEKKWNELLSAYQEKYPEEYKLFVSAINGQIGDEWKKALPSFNAGEKIATRSASGKVINAIADKIPQLIGGSADLAPSNNTEIKNGGIFSSTNYSGRNLHFGIREHAMGSMLNGMILYGGVIPYGGTFLMFSDYLRPVLRLAGLSHINPIFIFTHDSIGLGEDGPTHQPVEHFAALRSIPKLNVIRPADANETSYAWQMALESKNKPSAILLTRQNLKVIDREKYASAENTLKGGYRLNESLENPDLIIIATGSEVNLALEVAEDLATKSINASVVSMPSCEVFNEQSEDYKESVLPKSVAKRVSIEAGVSFGWHKYIGKDGLAVSIEEFGKSAPADELFKDFGFDKDSIVEKIKSHFNI